MEVNNNDLLRITPQIKNSKTFQLPSLYKKGLLKAEISEKEISDFMIWAFDEILPTTFRELCIIWNSKFGDILWLNLVTINSSNEAMDLFFKMGRAYRRFYPKHS